MTEPAASPLLDAALRLYHSATTPQQERDAYLLARALGLPGSYGERNDLGRTSISGDGNPRQHGLCEPPRKGRSKRPSGNGR